MHQEKEYKTAVDKNVHDPPEEIFSQYPELKEYIENKDFQQSKNFQTEKCREDSSEGRKKPGGD
jgi:hypothetical protein